MRERALRMWEALNKEYPESIVYRDNVANEHFRIGEFCEADRHTEEAEAHFRTASSLWGELAPRHPGRPDLKYNRAKALFRLGRLHAATGHRAEAATDFRTAQALWEGLQGKLREDYTREFRADLERDLKAAAGDHPG
jgi:tetratricopeptide (TPR) repeat protein